MGKQVGSLIRSLREKRGLSQSDLAKLLNLKTAQSISNIERGVSPLPRTKIKRLADVLGVKKNEIVTVVLGELQDRYVKAVGVQSRNVVSTSNLSSDECSVLQLLAEKFRTTEQSKQKVALMKQVKKLID